MLGKPFTQVRFIGVVAAMRSRMTQSSQLSICRAIVFSFAVAYTTLLTGSQLARAADNQPPEGFIALFNGRDLAGWKGLLNPPNDNPIKRAKLTKEETTAAQTAADENMRAHWVVEDGVLIFDGRGRSLCTAKDYSDFELLLDWKILANGDSGIYLRGTPQVQIWDPHSKIAAGVGSGGLYNNQTNPSKPITVADRPIGEWNTFRITMIGDHVSVWLNDTLVTDNVKMENFWDRKQPIPCRGQIELQNHGDNLYFKNIYIRELK